MTSSSIQIEVIKSYYTDDGEILSILKCLNGKLRAGSVIGNDQLSWLVVKENIPIGRKSDHPLQERLQRHSFFMYKLLPIDHTAAPLAGDQLTIENRNPGS